MVVEILVFGDENERELTKEVERALEGKEIDKARDVDNVRAETLKRGGVAVLE